MVYFTLMCDAVNLNKLKYEWDLVFIILQLIYYFKI